MSINNYKKELINKANNSVSEIDKEEIINISNSDASEVQNSINLNNDFNKKAKQKNYLSKKII